MSVQRFTRIHCENVKVGVPYKECPDPVRTMSADNIEAARAWLKSQGWTRRHHEEGLVDLCRHCSEHGTIKPLNKGGRPRKEQTDG